MQNSVTMPSQPQLGTPVPGSTGGLPAVRGLSVTQNPMAQQLQSMGRGEDTMLVHMTPNEVNSLQGLAMAAGGSLTINPQTGLPEAGFLAKLLPTLIGVGLAATGVGAPLAAGIVAAGQTALTGDLSKGLMAGLGAFGGASLAGAAGLGGAISENAFGVLSDKAGILGANMGAGAATVSGATPLPAGVMPEGTSEAFKTAFGDLGAPTLQTAAAPGAVDLAKLNSPGFLERFGATARQGLPGGIIGTAAPYAAGMGLLNTVSEATAPQMPKYDEEDYKSTYVPMGPGRREVRYQTPEQMRESGGAEFQYFTPSNPEPIPLDEKRGYAEGGVASLPAGGFEDLVSYFNATNPGAITASMYPTSPGAAPTSGGEVITNFARPAPNATANNLGLSDGMGPYGNFNIVDFNGLDIDTLLGNLGYSRQQPAGQSAGASQPSVMPSSPVSGPNLEADLLGGYGGQGPQLELPPAIPATTPVAPAYVPPIMANYTLPMQQPMVYAPAPESESGPIRRGGRGSGVGERFESSPSLLRGAYAQGGAVNMRDGSFVVDARTVSELGNGSSNAGIETLMKMGGRPVRGPGDGVSDSVRASIGGKQEARVARDEVIFSPEAVRRLGGGSDARGTKKLYALMEKAHKARKKAQRGQDTKVRKGLA